MAACRLAIAVFCCCATVAVCAETSPETDTLIIPGERVGPIRNALTEEGLVAMLPGGQVKRDLLSIGEDFYLCGTTVFAGTNDAVFVRWENGPPEYDGNNEVTRARCDSEPPMRNPKVVTIHRPWDGPAQKWETEDHIRIGMTFNALAELHGGPLLASVCPCDYGGTVYPDQERRLRDHMRFWIGFPPDVEARLAAFIRPELDYELSSANVPRDMQHEFPLVRIDVQIGLR